jgi:hypothetical protein
MADLILLPDGRVLVIGGYALIILISFLISALFCSAMTGVAGYGSVRFLHYTRTRLRIKLARAMQTNPGSYP